MGNAIEALEQAEEAVKVWETYDSAKTYLPLQKVSRLGSSYICKAACKGVAPELDVAGGVEGAHWLLIASKGDQGEQGAEGPQGKTGKQGIQGERGLTGERGVQGIQGIQGPQGVQGAAGPVDPRDRKDPRVCRGRKGRAASTAWAADGWHGQFQRDRRGASAVYLHRQRGPGLLHQRCRASMPKHLTEGGTIYAYH